MRPSGSGAKLRARLACAALVFSTVACEFQGSSEIVVAKVGARNISAAEFAFPTN